MKIKYSSIAMSRNKYSSFRTAERVWKTLFKANVTVLLLVLINNVNISRLNWIGRQLQPVELAAGELADNFSLVQGMTFHTQSNNRNKVKGDIGRHILNDLNFNIKRRENLKATYPVIFWKWHW